MSKRLELVPCGWECSLADCPPGPFAKGGGIGFKTEYGGVWGFCAPGGGIRAEHFAPRASVGVVCVPALEGITDPTEALAAIYAEVTHG